MPPSHELDVRPIAATLFFLPIKTRVPLKFGPENTTEVTCARVRLTVRDARGRQAVGWGETPLSVQWVWPSGLSYEERHEALKSFCVKLAEVWSRPIFSPAHPMELGWLFNDGYVPAFRDMFNEDVRAGSEPLPHLAALVCN